MHIVENRQKLLSRVRRIAGQVQAVEAQLAGEADCSQVLQLVASVRGAVGGLMEELIEQHMREHVARPGLFEAPFGLTLRQVIDDFGGRMPPGSKFKFALTGGAAGTIVGGNLLDVPLDYASTQKGISLGAGAFLICDGSVSVVAMLRELLHFFAAESCGKCTPCRVGTWRASAGCGELCPSICHHCNRGEADGCPYPQPRNMKRARPSGLSKELNCCGGVSGPLLLVGTTQLEHFDLHTAYGHHWVQVNRPAIAPLAPRAWP